MSTIAYKPILANFTDVNGELDFTSHDFEFNEDGSVTYYEKQVGCFTADKPYMEQDEEHPDRKYIYAKCAIPRQYTAAADIIERKGGTKLSAELCVNKMSYDSNEKCLLLEDIVLMGCTLLGTDPETGNEVQEGMENARLDIVDFSVGNNSSFSKEDLIDEITQAVMSKLDNHINNNQGKEECGLENFEEEIKKIDEEVTTVVEEVAEEVKATEEETPEVVEKFDGTDDTTTNDANGANGANDANGANGTNGADTPTDETPVVEEQPQEEINYTDDGNMNNGQQDRKAFCINGVNFETSLSEIMNCLYELVNDTYSESDNDYYYIDVYESSKTVIMSGMFTGRSYKQGYKVRNGVYSLTGDRIPVKAVYVTADEEAELDKMRSTYAAISDKLAKYESEPEKMAVLNSSDYISIADQKDFEELKKQENHFDLSVDDVKDKADAMLLQYAKSGKLNFAKIEPEQQKEETKKDFFAFARVVPDNSFLDKLLKN